MGDSKEEKGGGTHSQIIRDYRRNVLKITVFIVTVNSKKYLVRNNAPAR